jgi:hypothetical protein
LASNNPIVMCFNSQLLEKKLTTTAKNIMGPFWHPKIKCAQGWQAFGQRKLHMFYWCLVHQCRKDFLAKNLLDVKFILRRNWKANMWN